MITYNDILEIVRKERYSEQLNLLPKNFIQDIAEYFRDKTKFSSKEEDIFSEAILKTKKQLENAISIFRELMKKRKKKILSLAFIAVETGISKRDYDNMLDFEKEMFDKIVKNLEDEEKRINSLVNNSEKTEAKTNMMIFFKENADDFMDLEGHKLGPFEKGDIASLPEDVAKILIESGRAEKAD
jgi:DNA replication initiation complex subunit (GINS family)